MKTAAHVMFDKHTPILWHNKDNYVYYGTKWGTGWLVIFKLSLHCRGESLWQHRHRFSHRGLKGCYIYTFSLRRILGADDWNFIQLQPYCFPDAAWHQKTPMLPVGCWAGYTYAKPCRVKTMKKTLRKSHSERLNLSTKYTYHSIRGAAATILL